MKKIIILVVVVILSSSFGIAQSIGKTTARMGLSLLEAKKSKYETDSSTKGTPYINDEFLPAVITPINRTFLVRYNAVNDNMEVHTNGKTLILDKSDKKYTVSFTGKKKNYKIVDLLGETRFVVVLSEGKKVSLYKKEKKIFINKKPAAYASLQEKPAEYKVAKDRYFVEENGVLKRIKLKKKTILSLFPDKTKELKNFINKKKIKFTKEADLARLFDYANSL